jgi:phosphoribosyl 1,2-cyclic phosphodiesterase
MFYYKFWSVINDDIVDMSADFHKGEPDIYRSNFSMITQIPKVSDASNIKQFRHISQCRSLGRDWGRGCVLYIYSTRNMPRALPRDFLKINLLYIVLYDILYTVCIYEFDLHIILLYQIW